MNKYIRPQIEVLSFDETDIIVTSPNLNDDTPIIKKPANGSGGADPYNTI